MNIRNRVFAWILAIAMVFTSVPGVFAADGDELNWILTSDGVLTISGTGAMGGSPWAPHSGEIKKVIIEEGCTSICYQAFYECPLLEEVILPESLDYLEQNAFLECPRLKHVYIPSGVRYIQPDAFYGCPNLERIDVSPENQNYASDAYGVVYTKDMSQLLIFPRGYSGSYTVEGTVLTIGGNYRVTYGQYNWTTNDRYYGFSGAGKLTQINLSEGVEILGNYIFNNCTGLTSVVIPNSVTEIGEYTFQNCSKLESIDIGSGVKSIGSCAFTNCDALQTMRVPGNVRSLGVGVFSNCDGLEAIVLEDGITKIEDSAFYDCDKLKEVQLPRTISSINDQMFRYCYALESITIPSKVVQIDSSAFYGCNKLSKVTFAGNAPEFATNAFSTSNLVFYYPEGDETWNELLDTNAGQSSTITWVLYELIQDPEQEVPIYVVARGTCGKNITWILETDGTLTISGSGDMDFFGTSAANYMVFGNGSNMAPWAAFADQITGLVVEEGITSIADSAFEGCVNLESADIAASVQTVGDSAFANCQSLEEITFAGEAPEFGEDCFQGVDATITHPADESWTEDALAGTGGNVTLAPVEPEEPQPPVEHEWVEATCEAPKTCSICGQTEGEALGHSWLDATCETAKTCSICQKVDGEALGHQWTEATCETAKTCSVCQKVDGEALGHQYEGGVCVNCGTADPDAPVKPDVVTGDANGDGKIDYKDAMLVLRASVGLETLDEAGKAAGDVDGNSKLDYKDAMKILRASVGLEEL